MGYGSCNKCISESAVKAPLSLYSLSEAVDSRPGKVDSCRVQ
jgi:hypothetical protein